MKFHTLKILFAIGAATILFSSTGLTAFAKIDSTGGATPDGYLPSTGAAEPTGPLPSKQYTEPIGPLAPTTPLPTTDYTPPQKYDANYKLIVPIPGFTPQGTVNPLDYIKGIYNFGIGFGMLVAMAIIIYAGLKWTTSAGNISAQSEAKDMILNAVLGVAMLLGAFLILSFINPSLTKLTLPTLKPVDKTDFNFGDVGTAAATRQRQADVRSAEKTYESALAEQRKLEGELAGKYAGSPISLEDQIRLAKAKMDTAQALVGEKSATAAAARAVYDQAIAASRAYEQGYDVSDVIGELSAGLFGTGTSQSKSLAEIENAARINWTHADNEEQAARQAAVTATKNWIDLNHQTPEYEKP